MRGRKIGLRVKDPAGTRQKVLAAALAEMHSRGFRAASLQRVLRAAGVTKGALYHHFRSKRALAQAVVSERLGGHIEGFTRSLVSAEDPVTALRAWLEGPTWGPLRLGCPLNNLAQEMAATDDAVRRAVEAVFVAWRGGIAEALRRGQKTGRVRADVDAPAVAGFILASFEGSVSLAKSAQDDALYASNMRLLSSYVESLRGHPREG